MSRYHLLYSQQFHSTENKSKTETIALDLSADDLVIALKA